MNLLDFLFSGGSIQTVALHLSICQGNSTHVQRVRTHCNIQGFHLLSRLMKGN